MSIGVFLHEIDASVDTKSSDLTGEKAGATSMRA